MSIIEEALRRLQGSTPHASAPTVERPPSAQPEPPRAHSWTVRPAARQSMTQAPKRVAWLLPILSLALLGGAVAWFVRVQYRTEPPASSPLADRALNPAHLSAGVPPSIVQGIAPSKQSDEPFVLHGIVEGGGQPYAVINGAIVGVGETVEGALLLTIAGGAVTMRLANGKEIRLSLAH